MEEFIVAGGCLAATEAASHRRNIGPFLDLGGRRRLAILALLLSSAGCGRAESTTGTATGTATEAARPTATEGPRPVSTPTATPAEARPTDSAAEFDGDSAYSFLLEQMSFGPRWPGSPGHAAVGDFVVSQVREFGWATEEQIFDYQGITARNIIGRANAGMGAVIIVGAHYDTRKIADQSPGSAEPVPGAVDGASGVAVLLELARTLDLATIEREVWLAFFDVEDNGSGAIPGFEWIVGSTYMAENLAIVPEAMVLVDMVGDADQQLYYEANSDLELSADLWRIAADLGFGEHFIPEVRHRLIDDHLPFARLGIPAVDIIDFDYLYWHTNEDTADKASPESLMRVGRTLEVWLEERLDG